MNKETTDRANGYEAHAAEFMAHRDRSRVGAATVREWTRRLPEGASVLDLGCGHGVPVSAELMDAGCRVWGVDASPALVWAFRQRFPNAEVACEAVEDSSFFGRTFDGVVAIGLMFLLPAEAQGELIGRVAAVLEPGGRFLFTAPTQRATWNDLLTGLPSVALGARRYESLLSGAGLAVEGELVDEGENHYYACRSREGDTHRAPPARA